MPILPTLSALLLTIAPPAGQASRTAMQVAPTPVARTPVAATVVAATIADAAISPEVRLRKLHVVRPDLIPFPLARETYC